MDIFFQIGLMFIIAALLAYAAKLLKQPLITAYIAAGIIISQYSLNIIEDTSIISTMAEIGVVFLLFITGLGLSPMIMKGFGKISLFTGIGQVLFTSIIGFFILYLFGFSVVESVYIAVALTFSSTIIIMKLLSDKGETETLHGRIAIGFLIVQDIIAMFILMVISSVSEGAGVQGILLNVVIKASVILFALALTAYYVMPQVMSRIAKSQEFLLIFSVAWCLGLSILFRNLGFSIELGALLAGVTLSVSTYRHEISSRLRPIRDFFLVIFFIYLGSNLIFTNISFHTIAIVALSLFILVGNPLIVMAIMGAFGYSRRTGFMAGLTVAQISEFSLILVALGVKLGHLSAEILSLVTIIGIITIAGSVYMVTYSSKIYPKVSRFLKIFEIAKRRKEGLPSGLPETRPYDVILFGHNRMGFSLLNKMKDLKMRLLVVDFDPNTINSLEQRRINCVYGDVQDVEFLGTLDFRKTWLIISTIPEIETNRLLLEYTKARNRSIIAFVTSHNIEEAFQLYKEGADYVILPHFLGGERVSSLIEEIKGDHKKLNITKLEHITDLKTRMELEHVHPREGR
ncbi:MAG TPA: cation:proton antiporter [Candidatus Nanoarchaeia archaeon]|nr:cation:proton antiporter [Candidatus Nanoarchaeia archaeon]